MGASVEGKDIPDEWFRFSLPRDHGCNLNDRVDLSFGKNTLSTCTLDVETHDS